MPLKRLEWSYTSGLKNLKTLFCRAANEDTDQLELK
jgi:hypothetical protein